MRAIGPDPGRLGKGFPRGAVRLQGGKGHPSLALKSKLIVKLARRALGRAGRPAPGEPVAPVDAPLLEAAVTPRGSDSVIWPSSLEQPGAEVRQAAMRVLVISRDRHFRSVTSMLLSHRGCSVTATVVEQQAHYIPYFAARSWRSIQRLQP